MTNTDQAAEALERAAQILVNEFSYDGEDPNGVKVYQKDVDYFKQIASELRVPTALHFEIQNSAGKSLQ